MKKYREQTVADEHNLKHKGYRVQEVPMTGFCEKEKSLKLRIKRFTSIWYSYSYSKGIVSI